MVTIATWNVNSVRVRLPQLLDWLRDASPDIVALQELKTVDENFPRMEVEELGYNVAAFGQKTYNGVALLSKYPMEDVMRGLPGHEADEQARYIEAVVNIPGGALRVASVYVPNGQAPDSDKFTYKMAFYDRLYAHTKQLLQLDEKLILAGDYNVAPHALDVYAPAHLEGTVCFHPKEREKLRCITHLGMHDAFRELHPQTQAFSWWDYRDNGYATNKGLRIDHLLLSPQAADALRMCEIHQHIRAQEKASDHAPVVCGLEIRK